MGVDLRCASQARAVIPLGIEYIAGGAGGVTTHGGLVGVQLVDEEQARGALGKRIAGTVGGKGPFKARDHAAVDGNRGVGIFWLSVITTDNVLVLVVVRRGAFEAPGCTLGARLISVERRHLLEIVVAVGRRRTEAGVRIAQISAGPLVSQETYCVGVVISVGIDIASEPGDVCGREKVVAHDVLDARSIRHAQRLDGIDVRHLKGALCLIDLVLAQRDE